MRKFEICVWKHCILYPAYGLGSALIIDVLRSHVPYTDRPQSTGLYRQTTEYRSLQTDHRAQEPADRPQSTGPYRQTTEYRTLQTDHRVQEPTY